MASRNIGAVVIAPEGSYPIRCIKSPASASIIAIWRGFICSLHFSMLDVKTGLSVFSIHSRDFSGKTSSERLWCSSMRSVIWTPRYSQTR